MATKLTKPVTRATTLKDANGVEGEVSVTICEQGVTFVKGRRKLNTVPWNEIGKLATLPSNAPNKFQDNQLGWLIELSDKKE